MSFKPKPARQLVFQALLLPLSSPVILAKLFWPTLIPLVLTLGLPTVGALFGKAISSVYSLGLAVLMFLVLARGLVGWHRWCVLGEQPDALALKLEQRDFRYWFCWLGIGILYAILSLFIFVVVCLVPLFLLGFENFSLAPGLNLTLTIIAIILIAVIFARIYGDMALELVAIAIGSKEPSSVFRLGRSASLDATFWQPLAACLVVLQLPPLVEIELGLGVVVGFVSLLFWIYGIVVFASVLSLYYRDHRHIKGRET